MIYMNVAALTLLAAAVSLTTRERIEKTLPFAMLVTILCAYALGLAGLMGRALVWAWWAASAGAFVLAARHCVRRRGETGTSLKSLILTPGLLAFAVLAVFLWFFSRECEPIGYDEFSHWALTAKDMFFRNRFSTDAQAATAFKTYPPAMALWEVLFAKSLPRFSSGALFYAYNLFIVLTVMPLFERVRWRQAVWLPVLIAVVFMLPYTFYNRYEGIAWQSLFIDKAQAFCFGYALLSYFLEEKRTAYVYLRAGCAMAVLALLKSTSNYTAAVAGLLIAADTAAHKAQGQGRRAAKCAAMAAIWLAATLSWNAYLRLTGTPRTWSASRLTPQALLDLASGRAPSWMYPYTGSFLRELLEPSSSLPGVIQIGFALHPLVWLGLALCEQRLSGERMRRVLARWLALSAGYVGFIAALYGTYLFVFTQKAAVDFASIHRYLAVYWLGAYVFFLVKLLVEAFNERNGRGLRAAAVAGCTAFVLLTVPVEQIALDLRMGANRNKFYADYTEFFYLSRANIWAAREALGEGEAHHIYLVGTQAQYMIAQYELLPNCLCPWGEWEFPGDQAQWEKTLTDGAYEYVWVEYADEDFIRRCGASFEGGVSEDTLYEVRQEEGGAVRLIPVFQPQR